MFDVNRALHSRGVAILMRRLAPSLGLDENRMALLGWVHDLGCLTGDEATHASALADLLGEDGYEYADTVGRHGQQWADWSDPVDALLNIADMSVDAQGRLVDMETRLQQAVRQYGASSDRVRVMRLVIRRVRGTDAWATVRPVIQRMPEYGRNTMLDG